MLSTLVIHFERFKNYRTDSVKNYIVCIFEVFVIFFFKCLRNLTEK